MPDSNNFTLRERFGGTLKTLASNTANPRGPEYGVKPFKITYTQFDLSCCGRPVTISITFGMRMKRKGIPVIPHPL